MSNRTDERLQMPLEFDLPMSVDTPLGGKFSNVVCLSAAKERVTLNLLQCRSAKASSDGNRSDDQILGEILSRASRLSW
jgi:hypothetical protein